MPVAAQNLKVADFKPIDMVLHGKQIRTDFNNVEAAMVRVQLPVAGAHFDGNLIGEPEYYGSEYWVWLEGDAAGSGTSMFDIMCPGAPTLHVDFTEFGIRELKSKGVYELTLDIPEKLLYGRSSGPADLGGDYFVLTVTPKENVIVKVDGVSKVTRGGQLSEFLTYGDHNYTIDAPGYLTESGTVTISRGGGKVDRSVTLRSAMGTLTITAETPGTVISVNGQRRGAGSWSGALTAGNYQVEGTLEGYRPYSTALVMAEGQSKSLVLPALEPIYAALHVDYYPLKSQVKIDGKPVGVTPLALNNLTAGKHSLEITADGYQPYQQQITLTEETPLRLSGELTAEAKHTVAEANQYYNSKQYDKAVPIYRELAEQGDAWAQYRLGCCYDNGQGVAQSWTEAVKWYRKSAEQGNASAQYNLGVCYENGKGVEQSYAEAVKWYRKSAEQGKVSAQYNLGWCYENGEGVTQSYAEAVKWYRKSAEQGHAGAQNKLANRYWNGEGVAQNKDEAVRLWRLAAKQGNQAAKTNLKKFGYSE
ncbi:MAG: SEL1-like repeat protein [Muribaculaceae bacterium]|nr:SEL1-like repeat protein [Muribaculaceae bacterium]